MQSLYSYNIVPYCCNTSYNEVFNQRLLKVLDLIKLSILGSHMLSNKIKLIKAGSTISAVQNHIAKHKLPSTYQIIIIVTLYHFSKAMRTLENPALFNSLL